MVELSCLSDETELFCSKHGENARFAPRNSRPRVHSRPESDQITKDCMENGDSDVDIFTRVHFNENLAGHHDPHDLTINSDVDFY